MKEYHHQASGSDGQLSEKSKREWQPQAAELPKAKASGPKNQQLDDLLEDDIARFIDDGCPNVQEF